MSATIQSRVEMFLQNETFSTEEIKKEWIATYIDLITNRICLRIGAKELPKLFETIVVEAVIKCYRRIYYEGIASEGTDGFSTSFVEDILNEYQKEFDGYIESNRNAGNNGRVVNLL